MTIILKFLRFLEEICSFFPATSDVVKTPQKKKLHYIWSGNARTLFPSLIGSQLDIKNVFLFLLLFSSCMLVFLSPYLCLLSDVSSCFFVRLPTEFIFRNPPGCFCFVVVFYFLVDSLLSFQTVQEPFQLDFVTFIKTQANIRR